MRAAPKTRARMLNMTLGALFGALLVASKEILAAVPGIELVSLLIIVWTRVFRTGAVPGIAVFIVLEGALYGFGLWWTMYLYIWYILWAAVMLIPPARHAPTPKRRVLAALGWAVLSGVYGLCFGALTAIPYFFRGGPATAFAYWLAGLSYDAAHGAGNFAAALVLSVPLIGLFTRLRARLFGDAPL